MRSNSITEHFEKIIKDYMVTSFTGQKLDQTFGDQFWEFTDEGGLMKVLEAICDVAEDAIKDYEERIGNLNEAVQAALHGIGIAKPVEGTMTGPTVVVDAPPTEPAPAKKTRAPRADKGRSRKKCVACEGSGKNSKGEDCPICKEVVVEPIVAAPEIAMYDQSGNANHVYATPSPEPPVAPTSTPPWLAQPAAPATPAFFPPPPPPPYWNPNA